MTSRKFPAQCLSGRRNEALDCEVYALHAARSLKLYLWRDDRWAAEESAIQQPGLFSDVPAVQAPATNETHAAEEVSAEGNDGGTKNPIRCKTE